MQTSSATPPLPISWALSVACSPCRCGGSTILKLCRGLLQIVTQATPVRRGTLVEPQVPQDCPADVLKLIHDCTALIAVDRPDTKVDFFDYIELRR